MDDDRDQLNTTILRYAYGQGFFPMAKSRDSCELFWFDPDQRAVITWDRVHVPSRLRRFVRKQPFEVRFNTSFHEVIKACAAPREYSQETWINDDIIDLYTKLYHEGDAHCVEVWQDEKMVGGIYGVQIGGVFMAESMFSRVSNASKVALVHLLSGLYHADMHMVDVQFSNPHIEQFGVYEISRSDYKKRLGAASQDDVSLSSADFSFSGVLAFLQSITHTS